MAKTIYVYNKAFCLLFYMLFISCSILQSQNSDFVSWTSAGIEYKINTAFTTFGGLELRTKENLGEIERLELDIGAKYALFPFLTFGTGYEMYYRNIPKENWGLFHCYYFDTTFSFHLQRIKFILRERFQYTIVEAGNELRIRSRIKLAYDILMSELEPYVSVEMYNGLNNGEHFDIKRMRYRGGIVLPLSNRWKIDIFYCQQRESKKQENVIGIECLYIF